MSSRWTSLCATLLLAATLTSAGAQAIAPHKDELFSYPSIIERRDDGAFLRVDYRIERDLYGRDEIAERRAHQRYVSPGVNRAQVGETIDAAGRRIEVNRVGGDTGARFAVIFVHGRGGDRRLGVDDWSFGGNFNRLKNLVVASGGVYYAPSIRAFDAEGAADIAALTDHIAERTGGAPIVLACGSMGGILCWQAARDDRVASRLKGMVILGGPGDGGFASTPAYRRRVPVLLAHGTSDSVYPWQGQASLYESLSAGGRYPARFVLFETGSHGTPIRMIDWRETLNWMLTQ
jgi:pimeloyl-ACP methyl ester carboxylesterase